jgi:hypothetical protein
MKEGSKAAIKKIQCKKVNRYSKEECKAELFRLDNEEKDGESIYHKHILLRAKELGI